MRSVDFKYNTDEELYYSDIHLAGFSVNLYVFTEYLDKLLSMMDKINRTILWTAENLEWVKLKYADSIKDSLREDNNPDEKLYPEMDQFSANLSLGAICFDEDGSVAFEFVDDMCFSGCLVRMNLADKVELLETVL